MRLPQSQGGQFDAVVDEATNMDPPRADAKQRNDTESEGSRVVNLTPTKPRGLAKTGECQCKIKESYGDLPSIGRRSAVDQTAISRGPFGGHSMTSRKVEDPSKNSHGSVGDRSRIRRRSSDDRPTASRRTIDDRSRIGRGSVDVPPTSNRRSVDGQSTNRLR